jgi:hypothetical protein
MNNLSSYGVDIDFIDKTIRQEIFEVLNGDKHSFEIENIYYFDHYVDIIRSIVKEEDPIEIEDFNGFEGDFYYKFQYKNKSFAFKGSTYYNSYFLNFIDPDEVNDYDDE